MTSRSLRPHAALVVLFSSILVIGCGGDDGGSSPVAPTPSVPTPTPPPPVIACLTAPTGFRSSGDASLYFISWPAVPNATSYVFEMGTARGTTIFTRDVTLNASGDGGGSILIGSRAGTNAFTFVRGTTYFIRVKAKGACGIGAASSEIELTFS